MGIFSRGPQPSPAARNVMARWREVEEVSAARTSDRPWLVGAEGAKDYFHVYGEPAASLRSQVHALQQRIEAQGRGDVRDAVLLPTAYGAELVIDGVWVGPVAQHPRDDMNLAAWLRECIRLDCVIVCRGSVNGDRVEGHGSLPTLSSLKRM